ncbi:UDP-N-acetylglucosamine 2-epimerase [Sulfurimonas sp.]
MNKRKICVVTGTRAEYGLLRPLLQEIKNDEALDLQLIVTGTHFSKEFGETYKEIEQDFFTFTKVPMDVSNQNNIDIINAMAKLQIDMAQILQKLTPDIVVILGDRYEILSIATAAFMLQIPIAHIHGGEVTQGAIDDSIRHSVTKLSSLHFTATQRYKQRVIQLGEEPNCVFNVGSLGVQNIKNIKLLDKKAFEESINFTLQKRNLLVTFHPQTLSSLSPKEQITELLAALGELEDTAIIFTKANADAGGDIVNKMIEEFVKEHKNSVVFASLGMLKYLSAVLHVDGVVGNSSSGIIEVPSFYKVTVNIGNRQKGREQAKSVIDVDISKKEIQKAIEKIYDKEFIKLLKNTKSPYEADNTSKKIKDVLKNVDVTSLHVKRFYDLKDNNA